MAGKKKKKVILIENCYQCTTNFHQNGLGELDYCKKSKRFILPEDLSLNNGIPSWCKLEDADEKSKGWKWSLEINEEQARVIQNALDLYSRIQMGQLEDIYYTAIMALNKYKTISRDNATMAIRQLKSILFPELLENSSYGIHSDKINDLARVAWDLQQVIRNRLAHDLRPPKQDHLPWQVDYDTPSRSSNVPLAKIKTIGRGKIKE